MGYGRWLRMRLAAFLLLIALAGCSKPNAAILAIDKRPTLDLPAAAIPLPPPHAIPVVAATVMRAGIPPDAYRWRGELIKAVRTEWPSAGIATMAAQIHQESEWRADAVSPVGASGIAQFMPQTATWLSGAKAHLGPSDPTNPIWALRAMVAYNKLLWDSKETSRAADDCSHMAMVLSCYNGGCKWVERDRLKALTQSLRDDVWWDHVEKVNAGRSQANWTENRGYPRRILLMLEPRYEAAGWGSGMCDGAR
jgi:hypothetical protein